MFSDEIKGGPRAQVRSTAGNGHRLIDRLLFQTFRRINSARAWRRWKFSKRQIYPPPPRPTQFSGWIVTLSAATTLNRIDPNPVPHHTIRLKFPVNRRLRFYKTFTRKHISCARIGWYADRQVDVTISKPYGLGSSDELVPLGSVRCRPRASEVTFRLKLTVTLQPAPPAGYVHQAAVLYWRF